MFFKFTYKFGLQNAKCLSDQKETLLPLKTKHFTKIIVLFELFRDISIAIAIN